jgi:tRNA pseudouridine55 synthase
LIGLKRNKDLNMKASFQRIEKVIPHSGGSQNAILSDRNTDAQGPRERLDESGVLVIDKPAGITSMDVIRVLRRVSRVRKIGHGGTLDPFATGVLPILINNATRASGQIMDGIKEYEGTFVLGLSYDTQDMTGQPLHEPKPVDSTVNLEVLNQLAQKSVGWIEQMPPMYSAVKKNGRPLYDYARAGESVEVAARKVHVEDFKITEAVGPNEYGFFVRSSKGVYVRTLIHDLGQILGCGAVVKSLSRTQTGPFHIDEAVQLSTLRFISDIRAHLKPLSAI